MLDGMECDKVGPDKYLTYDELCEAQTLEVADPNLMVELIDDEEMKYEEAVENEDNFFHMLLNFTDGLEQQYEMAGEKLTIKKLKEFAKDFLAMPKD